MRQQLVARGAFNATTMREKFIPSERPLSKERLIPLFAVLNISGLPGTGKSTAAEILGERLKIAVLDVGQKIREESESKTGEKAIGFVERDISVDKRFDERTAEIIRHANTTRPLIITARLAPWITRVEEEGRKDFPPVINILLTAKAGVRHRRILRREKEGHPELKLKDIAQATRERERKDQEFFHEAHPELQGDPLDEGAKYKGRPIYDCVISTDNRSIEEVADEIIECLLAGSLVIKEGDPPQLPQLPPQGIIFPAA